jgi:prevent-host-death family protein
MTPTEAKRKLAGVLNSVEFGHNPVIVARHGRDIAALVPIRMFEVSQEMLRGLEDEEDWKEIQQALADPENALPLDWDPAKYGAAIQNQDSSKSRQGTGRRARAAAKPARRRDRGARR